MTGILIVLSLLFSPNPRLFGEEPIIYPLKQPLRLTQRQFRVNQRKQYREWHERERSNRHDFFRKNLSGPDRRKYIQDYLERKKSFEAKQDLELEAFHKNGQGPK